MGTSRVFGHDSVLLNLAGLRICRVDGRGAEPYGQDLVWRHHRGPNLPGGPISDLPFTNIRGQESGNGVLTDLLFGYGDRVSCRFTVSADGRCVESWADAGVSDRDLLGLFGEHILRTVLVRRGLISFHAAALSNGDAAILIMGDKGMGKSTLSSALQQRGWQSVADDLARVANHDDAWRTFPGLRDTKLLPDSITALGLAHEALSSRWDDPMAGEAKRLLRITGAAPAAERAFRLAALFVLRPRLQGASALSSDAATPLRAVQALLEHATRDPLDPEAPPPMLQRAIGDLVRSLPVIEIALPDRLDALRTSAEQVEAIAKRARVRRAA